jgi:hypothetical protein
MTILWAEGFDTYGDTLGSPPSPTNIFGKKYISEWNLNQGDIEAGRTSNCFEHYNGVTYDQLFRTPDLDTTNATLIAGAAYRFIALSVASLASAVDYEVLNFYSDTVLCVSLHKHKDSFTLEDGNGVVLASTRCHLTFNTWYFIEMKAYCHDTAGTIEVRVNSCPIMSLSNIDTKLGSLAYFNRVEIKKWDDIDSASGKVDDFYVIDGAGAVNNDFLGDITVHTIFPDGDDSVNFATTGNGSYSTHHEQVGYPNALDTTDYIEDGGTTGNRDIFTMDATLNFDTVHGIVGWVHTLGISSDEDYHFVVDSNGTETESVNISTPGTTTCHYDLFVVEQDPDASAAWTPSTVNAMKFGIEIQ